MGFKNLNKETTKVEVFLLFVSCFSPGFLTHLDNIWGQEEKVEQKAKL